MSREGLGNFELMVLLAVVRVGEDAYGVPIARTIQEKSGREVFLGRVYAALTRLEGKGLVASTIGDPTSERGGKAKKYFRITARGLREAREAQRTLVSLWRGLPELQGGAARGRRFRPKARTGARNASTATRASWARS